MFKNSLVEGSRTHTPVAGKFVFKAYEEVRDEPENQPPFLEYRLSHGEDLISIWFQHIHDERFKAMDQWLSIKILSQEAQGKNLLPKTEEMTPHEILEFCKSIDVHPAHLVPWVADKSLSLPTPLLELLIEMAYDKNADKKYDQSDIYLAKRGIDFECRRIVASGKMDEHSNPYADAHSQTLSSVFTYVLNNPFSMMGIDRAKVPKLLSRFGTPSSQSYPYQERVEDSALNKAELEVYQSHYSLEGERHLAQKSIKEFVGLYQKHIYSKWHAHIEARNFLEDVMDKYEAAGLPRRMADVKDIENVIVEQLKNHAPYHDRQRDLRKTFAEKIHGAGMRHLSERGRHYMEEMEDVELRDLAFAVKAVFDSFECVKDVEVKHKECEGRYILNVGDIRNAFKTVQNGYQRNLLSNRVLLALSDINVQKYIAPQASPR